MKDDLGEKIMKEFIGLRAKIYSYLKNNDKDKKAKRTKICMIKRKLKLYDYENCLEATQIDEAKYQLLLKKKKKERTGSNYFNDSKAFIEYWNGIDDIYKNVKEYNPNKKRKILIIFHGMIIDILINKKLNPIVTELFIRGRKLSISLLFIALSYFAAPKDNWLYSTHYFVMKILNKIELQQIAFNHSSNIDFQDLINLYKKCTAKPYSFLVTDTTLASDNLLCFRKNLVEKM